jgi:hypothetical protein
MRLMHFSVSSKETDTMSGFLELETFLYRNRQKIILTNKNPNPASDPEIAGVD